MGIMGVKMLITVICDGWGILQKRIEKLNFLMFFNVFICIITYINCYRFSRVRPVFQCNDKGMIGEALITLKNSWEIIWVELLDDTLQHT